MEVVNLQGEEPCCSFCKVPRTHRKYLFMNETRDTFVCESCVAVLHGKLIELNLLGGIDASSLAN